MATCLTVSLFNWLVVGLGGFIALRCLVGVGGVALRLSGEFPVWGVWWVSGLPDDWLSG